MLSYTLELLFSTGLMNYFVWFSVCFILHQPNPCLQVSEASGQALPFKLDIINLRPDLFRVREHGLEPESKRNVRSSSNPANSTKFESIMQPEFDSTASNLAGSQPENKIQQAQVWNGPSVWFLPSGISYSGENTYSGLQI